jgi:hypothetical protein
MEGIIGFAGAATGEGTAVDGPPSEGIPGTGLAPLIIDGGSGFGDAIGGRVLLAA